MRSWGFPDPLTDAGAEFGDGGSPLVFPVRARSRLRDLSQGLPVVLPRPGNRGDGPPALIIETAPAHIVGNKVEAAYARSDLFERRRRLMDEWATHFDGERGQGAARYPRDESS